MEIRPLHWTREEYISTMDLAHVERTVLVVDDDVFVAAALADVLSDDGFNVHTASNGFSAVRLAMETQPSVVLLDLLLPEKSGIDVLDELRGEAATRDVAIVVVSGNVNLLSEAQVANVDGVIGKPFDVSDLVETVHRAIQHAAHRRAEIAPIVATSHRRLPARVRRAAGIRRPRPPLSN